MPSKPKLLERPTKVILTGGTSGIGHHLLTRLLDGGHEVVVMARRALTLTPQPRLIPIDVDLADVAAIKVVCARLA